MKLSIVSMLVCVGACVCMFVGIYVLRIVTTDKIHSLQIRLLFYLLSLKFKPARNL